MIASFLPKPSGKAASWEEVDAVWEEIDKTPEEKEAERIAATTKRTEEIPQSDDDPKLTRIRKQSEAVIHNLGVDYPHIFEAIKVTSKFVDETIKQSDIAPVAKILEEGSKKAARGAEMWATGSDIYNPITEQQIGTLPDLDVDPAAARFIGSTTFGAATESVLFKAIAATKKIKVDFPTGGGQQLIPVGNQIPISNQFDNVVSKVDDLPSTAQPLQAVSGVNPGSKLRGSEYIEGLKTVIKSDPPIKDVQGFVKTGAKELIETKAQRIERYLNKGLSQHLNSKYKNTRQGYWNAKKLANDPKLLNKVIQQHDEVNKLFKEYKALERSGASKTALSNAQRKLYDAVGENFFNDDALIYGKHSLGDQARKKLVKLTQWFSQDHWHHIFGNKEVGEFLLTEIAQDPLIAVNLFKHMKKRGLNSSGIAQNILIMKEKGHKNFHDFLRDIGIEGRFGNKPKAGIEDFGQEISKVVRGEAKAAKTFTTETGEVIAKGTPYQADPGAVNELFTLIDQYVEMNKFMKQKFKEGAITVMEPTGSKGLRKVVPNGYKAKKGESVFVYDLTANTRGKPQLPEIYSDKVGRVKKVMDTSN